MWMINGDRVFVVVDLCRWVICGNLLIMELATRYN